MNAPRHITSVTCRVALTAAIASLCITSSPAQPTLTVGSTPGYPGASVLVPVSIGRATNIVAAQFEVSYSTNLVAAGAAVQGQASGRQFVRSREVSPGVRRIVAYSLAKPLSTNRAIIARVPFTLSPTARDSSGPLMPRNAILAKSDATAAAPVALKSGTVFIQPVFLAEDGTAQFFLPAEPDERYLVEASTDFIHWLPISTNVAAASFLDLVDIDAPLYSHRFYRSAVFDALGQLDSVQLLPGGQFVFRISGQSNRSYTIQTSTNLVNWTNVTTVTAPGGHMQITNGVSPAFPTRFFRLSSSP